MTESFVYEKPPIVEGTTLPVSQIVARGEDGTVLNLVGFAFWAVFWYTGQEIHKVGQGYIYDEANGIARYEWDGGETPTPPSYPGKLNYYFVFENPGPANIQSAPQSWARLSTPTFVRPVLKAVEA